MTVDNSRAKEIASVRIRSMKKTLAAVALAAIVALAFLIPLAASSLGSACEFGPCEPSTLVR